MSDFATGFISGKVCEDGPHGYDVDCRCRIKGKMGTPQEAHLARVKEQVIAALDKKYRAGQSEHGGYLLDIGVTGLLDAAIDEAIDQATYLLSLRELLGGTRSERR